MMCRAGRRCWRVRVKAPSRFRAYLRNERIAGTGHRTEFENLAVEYASSFELSPPAWVDELVLPNQQEEQAAVPSSTVLFPPVIDAQVVKQTEQMTRAIQRKRQLRVDFSRVTSIDMIGADLLLRTFRDFRKARHELTICGEGAVGDDREWSP